MAPIAIFFGILMILLGGGFYAYTMAPTALIPGAFGLVLIVLGIVARMGEKARMHAMHGAALVGLIGVILPTVLVIRHLTSGHEFDVARLEQSIMAGLSLIFVVMCVKSFIDVRMARKQKEAEATPPA